MLFRSNNAIPFGFVPHGLVASITGVDDGKSAMSQSHKPVSIDILKVGTALGERLSGSRYIDEVELANQVKSECSGYATHVITALVL